MKIVHAGDIHLGRRRLDGRLPDTDFFEAFDFIAREAIKGNADAVVLAGDIFDHAQVEPPHLRQAQLVLQRLKQSGIPVLAIEGNHDRVSINSAVPTWMSFLAEDNLLILLRPKFDETGAILSAWDPVAGTGACHDLAGIRFIGAGYLGAATPNKIRQIVDKLDPSQCNVLLLHAGPDYFVGEGGGLPKEDLKMIKTKVRYLALGHMHMPKQYADWACNPGSPENCDLHESHYDLDRNGKARARGYAWVTIDPAPDMPASIVIHSNPRRPCLHVTLDCSPFGNKTKDGVVALESAAVEAIQALKPQESSVVNIRLTGIVNLNKVHIDSELVCRNIQQTAGVHAVALDFSGLNVAYLAGQGAGEDRVIPRDQLEKEAIRQLVKEANLWGLEDQEDAFVDLFYALKEGVREGRSIDELSELVGGSVLVDKVLAASQVNPATPPGPATQAGEPQP